MNTLPASPILTDSHQLLKDLQRSPKKYIIEIIPINFQISSQIPLQIKNLEDIIISDTESSQDTLTPETNNFFTCGISKADETLQNQDKIHELTVSQLVNLSPQFNNWDPSNGLQISKKVLTVTAKKCTCWRETESIISTELDSRCSRIHRKRLDWSNQEYNKLRMLSILGESRKWIGDQLNREESHVFSKIQKHQNILTSAYEYLSTAIKNQKKSTDLIMVEAKGLGKITKYLKTTRNFWEDLQQEVHLELSDEIVNPKEELLKIIPKFLQGVRLNKEIIYYLNSGLTLEQAKDAIDCISNERFAHKRHGKKNIQNSETSELESIRETNKEEEKGSELQEVEDFKFELKDTIAEKRRESKLYSKTYQKSKMCRKFPVRNRFSSESHIISNKIIDKEMIKPQAQASSLNIIKDLNLIDNDKPFGFNQDNDNDNEKKRFSCLEQMMTPRKDTTQVDQKDIPTVENHINHRRQSDMDFQSLLTAAASDSQILQELKSMTPTVYKSTQDTIFQMSSPCDLKKCFSMMTPIKYGGLFHCQDDDLSLDQFDVESYLRTSSSKDDNNTLEQLDY